jgi:antitoxin PrlF
MDVAARMTSKGQFTLPKAAREELGLRAGDELLVRVGHKQAIVAKTPDFLEWAGSVSVPARKRGTAWDEVLRQTRRARAEKRR